MQINDSHYKNLLYLQVSELTLGWDQFHIADCTIAPCLSGHCRWR